MSGAEEVRLTRARRVRLAEWNAVEPQLMLVAVKVGGEWSGRKKACDHR